MIGKYSTISSQKDSTCYYKWFRIATLHVYTPYINLHHYNIIALWKIIKIQNCTIQVHTFQPSKIRSSYLQRTAETYSVSWGISHMASCSIFSNNFQLFWCRSSIGDGSHMCWLLVHASCNIQWSQCVFSKMMLFQFRFCSLVLFLIWTQTARLTFCYWVLRGA